MNEIQKRVKELKSIIKQIKERKPYDEYEYITDLVFIEQCKHEIQGIEFAEKFYGTENKFKQSALYTKELAKQLDKQKKEFSKDIRKMLEVIGANVQPNKYGWLLYNEWEKKYLEGEKK